jgi:hypothetical protein
VNSSLLTPWAFHDADQYFRIRHNIAVAVVVSLLVHGLLLLVTISPRKQGVSAETRQGPLEVRLAEAAPPSPAETIAPPPDHGAYRPPAPHRDPPRVVKTPVQSAPPVDTPSVPTRQPDFTAQPDMMAMIHARRRGIEAAAARENAQARASDREPSINEAAAASITRNLQTLSQSRDGTSGVFQILRKGVRTAQFSFRGWTTDTSNQWRQVYEVDAGVRGNIELAIVRKMIELIRTHYQGNFNWDSHRLGRVVVLSARLDDNAGLEDFLMREFFGV